MIVQAEISLYPLGEAAIDDRIAGFIDMLTDSGLDVEVGKMSSIVSGECGDVFRVLSDAFEIDCEAGESVMTIKVSNACPSG